MIPQPIDQVPLFLKLTEEERELISSRLRHLEYNTNDVIFSANKPAEFLGVITQGWVKLESETPQGRIALANLGAGSVIGEVDLLLNRLCSTSARAASATGILALHRQDLQEIILERPAIGLKFSASLGTRVAYLDEYLVTQRLSTSLLLGGLGEEEMRALAGKLQFHSYQRGETIIEAGAPGDAVYLVEEGSARLITRSRDGESFEEMGEGELFGQTALITGKPFASTARAVTDVSAWVLSKEDYQELIGHYPAIKAAFSRALAENLDSADQDKAVEQLRALPLFADVDDETLRELASCLVLRHFPAGELVYGEGTPGDAMYFIEAGEIQLVSGQDGDAELLDRKQAGDGFGEMALLTGRTRGEAARALTDTTVWVLYKSDYDDLMVRHPTLSLALSRALSGRLNQPEEIAERHLLRIRLFNGLSLSELSQVSRLVKPVHFRPGETICYAGQPAQNVFMIESGEAREIAGGANGQAVVLSLLGAEQSFGERAVMQGCGYPTTLQAVGDVECWTMSKSDFDRALSRYPALALNVARMIADDSDRPNRRMARPTAPPINRPSMPPARRVEARPPAPPRAPQRRATAVGVRTVPGKPWERSTSSVMRPMPAANSRPVQMNGNSVAAAAPATTYPPAPAYEPRRVPARRTTPNGNGSISRLAGLSTGTKLKLAIAGVFVVFLMVILPLTLVVTFVAQASAGQGLFSGAPAPSEQEPANIQSNGVKRAAMLPSTGKIAVFERTATPTAVPATAVPTAKPTVKPTRKPVSLAAKAPPAQEPSPEASPTLNPTEAALAAAAAAPRPPLPPRQWDKRLGPGGLPLLTNVGVTEPQVSSGQAYFRLVKMVFQDAGAESGNDHTIYVTILDENGQRTEDQTVVVSWDESGSIQTQRLTLMDQKPKGDYCNCNYNWPMYGAAYKVKVDGNLPSDEAYGMIMPMHRHVNYLLTFQKVIVP